METTHTHRNADDLPDLDELKALDSWQGTDLDALASVEPRAPELLERDDGAKLLTRGLVTSIYGEPETGKTQLLRHAMVEELEADHVVLCIDYEGDATGFRQGLLDQGVTPWLLEADAGPRVIYIAPEWPITDPRAAEALDAWLEALEPSLVVIDGTTAGMEANRLDPNSNRDVAQFFRVLPRRCARAGAAVVMTDHVVKEAGQRGRWAVGAGAKLALVDVAMSLELEEPFGRGRNGKATLRITKDRFGFLRAIEDDDRRIADVALLSGVNGRLDVELRPPVDDAVERKQRMRDDVRRLLAGGPLLTTDITKSPRIKGRERAVRVELESMLKDGELEAEKRGRGVVYRLPTPAVLPSPEISGELPRPNISQSPRVGTESYAERETLEAGPDGQEQRAQ